MLALDLVYLCICILIMDLMLGGANQDWRGGIKTASSVVHKNVKSIINTFKLLLKMRQCLI